MARDGETERRWVFAVFGAACLCVLIKMHDGVVGGGGRGCLVVAFGA